MQNLDPTGVYTNDEVKEALSGASGVRDWDFRYERLDSQNNFIESLDSIQKCTIDNNALADIKRTAKFDILDTGTINYLQDRIKPYVRLNMPSAASSDYVDSLQPSQRFKLDVGNGAAPVEDNNIRSVQNDLNYATFDTADVFGSPVDSLDVYINPNSSTLRKEYWGYIDNTSSSPIDIFFGWSSDTAVAVYFQTGSTKDTLQLVSDNHDYLDSAPKIGRYYVRVYTNASTVSSDIYTSVEISRPIAVMDSVTGSAYMSYGTATPGVINDGGNALTGTYGVSVFPSTKSNTDLFGPAFNGSMSTSYWANIPSTWPTSASYDYANVDLYVGDSQEFRFKILADDADPNMVAIQFVPWNYNSGLVGTYKIVSLPKTTIRGVHNFAFTVETVTQQVLTIRAYLDGTLVGSVTVPYWSDLTTAAAVGTQYTAPRFSSGNGWIVDDLVFYYNKTLSGGATQSVYTSGISAKPPRRGYVEWPQGIFLLSSPTRTMKEGNEIVRSVEAYDQLLVLKEDSVDVRTSFAAGAQYTKAISYVLSTTNPLTVLPASQWVTTVSGVTNPSPGTYNLSDTNAGNPAAAAGVLCTTGYMAFDGCEFKGQVSMGTMDTVYLHAYVTDEAYSVNDREIGFWYDRVSNLLYVIPPKSNGIGSSVGTYSSTNHKYLRVRESNRTIYYDASSDGITWSTLYTAVNIYQQGSSVEVQFLGQANTSTTETCSISSLSFTGRPFGNIRVTQSTLTTPTAIEWEPGTTKLQIINDLLAAINYESAWYDENGTFIGRPYVSPTNRGSEFNYMTDANSVIAGDIDQTVDLFKIPNKWTLVVSEPDRPALVGTYTNSDPASPTSTVARGRTIVDFRTEQNAPDQVTLDAKAARLAFEASQVYEKIEFGTGLMPIHSNFDTYTLGVDGLAIKNKYSETAWSMDLDPGSIMKHTVRRIVNV